MGVSEVHAGIMAARFQQSMLERALPAASELLGQARALAEDLPKVRNVTLRVKTPYEDDWKTRETGTLLSEPLVWHRQLSAIAPLLAGVRDLMSGSASIAREAGVGWAESATKDAASGAGSLTEEVDRILLAVRSDLGRDTTMVKSPPDGTPLVTGGSEFKVIKRNFTSPARTETRSMTPQLAGSIDQLATHLSRLGESLETESFDRTMRTTVQRSVAQTLDEVRSELDGARDALRDANSNRETVAV
jgi:hypothetical protein